MKNNTQIERERQVVLKALEGVDYTLGELARAVDLPESDVAHHVNYWKAQQRIENIKHGAHRGLLHLRSAEPESPEPAAPVEVEAPETPAADPTPDREADRPTDPMPISAKPTIPQSAKLVRTARLLELRHKYAGKLPAMTTSPSSDDWHASRGYDGATVSLVDQRGQVAIGFGMTAKKAYRAAYRELRLAHYDRAALLRERGELKRENHQIRNDHTADKFVHHAEAQQAQAEIDRLKRELEELRTSFRDAIASAAGAAAAADKTRAASRIASADEAPAGSTPLAATLPINLPDPEWYDAHTLSYLRLGWPKLSPERKEEIAPRLLHEICQHPSERNSAWITIVKIVNQGDK